MNAYIRPGLEHVIVSCISYLPYPAVAHAAVGAENRLGKTESNVNTQRANIRRKLGLAPSDNLYEVLRSRMQGETLGGTLK